MLRKLLPVLILFSACNQAESPELVEGQAFSKGYWIDLTHEFSEKTIYWPTAGQFKLDTAFVGYTDSGYYYSAFNFCASEHGGTHLDAPVHFAQGKWSTEEIPVENLTGEAVVIDVSGNAMRDPNYQVTVNDLKAWESINQKIPDNSIALIRTGYGNFYTDVKKYLGTDERGQGAVAKLHFPGLHPDAASWLVQNRKIKAIGIDAASIDYGQSTEFQSHRILYQQNIPGFENVANLDKLPAKGAYIIALPVKIKGGSGGPLRIVAWLRGKNQKDH